MGFLKVAFFIFLIIAIVYSVVSVLFMIFDRDKEESKKKNEETKRR